MEPVAQRGVSFPRIHVARVEHPKQQGRENDRPARPEAPLQPAVQPSANGQLLVDRREQGIEGRRGRRSCADARIPWRSRTRCPGSRAPPVLPRASPAATPSGARRTGPRGSSKRDRTRGEGAFIQRDANNPKAALVAVCRATPGPHGFLAQGQPGEQDWTEHAPDPRVDRSAFETPGPDPHPKARETARPLERTGPSAQDPANTDRHHHAPLADRAERLEGEVTEGAVLALGAGRRSRRSY